MPNHRPSLLLKALESGLNPYADQAGTFAIRMESGRFQRIGASLKHFAKVHQVKIASKRNSSISWNRQNTHFEIKGPHCNIAAFLHHAGLKLAHCPSEVLHHSAGI